MNPSYIKDFSNVDWLERVSTLAENLLAPFVQLIQGVRAKTIPWIPVLSITFFLQFLVLVQIDRFLVRATGLGGLYPRGTETFFAYYIFLTGMGFWLWGVFRVGMQKRLVRRLTEVFKSCNLKNNLGKLPAFIFDKAIDPSTRKLRVSRAILPMEEFFRAKDALNGGLQVFIDEIRENRIDGTVDIIYSHTPMRETFRISDIYSIGKARFVVGTTRSKAIESDLDTCPHLLVAGQTGKGKSTFARQLITTLYLNDETAQFTLIDLKGGLEFQIFERLERVSVPESMKKALYAIGELSDVVDRRMELLKAHHCKDISAYFALVAEGKAEKAKLNRHIVVVDEAAEMFLAGSHASAQEIQTAKRVLSKIARQGRSLGIHLVIATQRPDTKSLDPQVKANLSGVICFQMANDASSLTVLGNGRATDLPPNPGRAIWKLGGEMLEVQTPLLETTEVEKLLVKEYKETPATPITIKKEKVQNTLTQEDELKE